MVFRLLRVFVKLIFSLPFLLLLLVGALVYERQFLREEKEDEKKIQEEVEKEIEEKKIETVIYEETPAHEGAEYFEKLEEIDGQWAYIAFPLEIEVESPPTLVIFSHGSNTRVSENLEAPFMKDMQDYGEFFTKNGYAFAASNQHGENWGNEDSIQDTIKVVKWVKDRYSVKEKVNMVAHSMGGLPTLHYTFRYPESVNKIALLAPTTYVWGQQSYDSLKKVQVKLWHGDKDVNIPWSVSKRFVDNGVKYGVNIDFVTLSGVDHWGVDTELKNEILEFFDE